MKMFVLIASLAASLIGCKSKQAVMQDSIKPLQAKLQADLDTKTVELEAKAKKDIASLRKINDDSNKLLEIMVDRAKGL